MPIERAVYHFAWQVYWTAPSTTPPPPPPNGPPVASFTTTISGTTASFDASASHGSSSSVPIASYAWDFGDGKRSTASPSPTTSHTYAAGGTYTASLTVTATDGQTNTTSGTVKIVIANKPPIASFTISPSQFSVAVDGSASSDSDGQIASYSWNFGDGATATGATASHTYATGGTKSISLTVKDNLGSTASVTKSVTLSSIPVAGFTASISGTTVSVDASSTMDANPINSYSWNWGDVITLPTYSFDTTNDQHIVTLHPTSTAVVQCVVKNPDTGNIYASQAAVGSNGTKTPYETTLLSRMDSTGALIDSMELVDAGHGMGISLQYISGKTYVWLTWDAPATTGGALHDIVRFPYPVGGGKFTRAAPPAGFTVMFSGLGYLQAQFDWQKDRVVLWNGGTRFQQGVLSDFVNKKLTIYNTVNVPAISPPTLQGFFTFDYSLFVYWGAAYTQASSTDPVTSPTDPPVLREYRWYDGVQIASYDPSWWGKPYLDSHYEPESSTLYYPVGGSPSAWVGWLTGAVGSFKFDILQVPLLKGSQTVPDPPGSGKTATHSYSPSGTYTITLTVTDSLGQTDTATKTITTSATNQPPVASFVSGSTNLTASFNASGSTDPDGSIASYAWTFGDGATGTGVTPSHTYASAGTYSVVLTVTDNLGATGTVTKSISVVNSAALPVYLQGDMMEGISTAISSKGIKVYTFSALGLSTSVTNLQTVVDALPGPGIIQLPANWTGHITNFAHHGTNWGIWNANLMGLLGTTNGSALTTTIIVDPGAETQSQADSLGNGTGVIPKAGMNTAVGALHLANTSPFYVSGIRFIGNDQVKSYDASDGRTGPGLWSGFALNSVGPSAIFQNCLLQGWGRADNSSPPGEVGNWNETHSVGLIFRRVEHDGMIAVGSVTRPSSTTTDPYGMGWRRGGGIQWNAASSFLMEDVYSHDAWVSGVTMSFTSLPSATSKESNNWTTRRLQVKDNAEHGTAPGSQDSGTFACINHEFNWGNIHHYQPRFHKASWSNWLVSHLKVWDQGTFSGTTLKMDPSFRLYVHQPIIDNANPLDGGCLSIEYHGAGTSYTTSTLPGGYAYPIVYLTSDETKPAKPYIKTSSTASAVPSYVTPANNYYIIKLS